MIKNNDSMKRFDRFNPIMASDMDKILVSGKVFRKKRDPYYWNGNKIFKEPEDFSDNDMTVLNKLHSTINDFYYNSVMEYFGNDFKDSTKIFTDTRFFLPHYGQYDTLIKEDCISTITLFVNKTKSETLEEYGKMNASYIDVYYYPSIKINYRHISKDLIDFIQEIGSIDDFKNMLVKSATEVKNIIEQTDELSETYFYDNL